MRNTIILDLEDACSCGCIERIADNTNRIFICATGKSGYTFMINDATVLTASYDDETYVMEIPSSNFSAEGSFAFNVYYNGSKKYDIAFSVINITDKCSISVSNSAGEYVVFGTESNSDALAALIEKVNKINGEIDDVNEEIKKYLPLTGGTITGDLSIKGTTTLKGDLILNETKVTGAASGQDYIVEQGTSGVWTYRKWYSGMAECWGTSPQATVSISTAWGSIYVKDKAIVSQAFPFEFVEVPCLQVSPRVTNGNFWIYTNELTTTAKTGAFGVARGNSHANVIISANFYAKGKWK